MPLTDNEIRTILTMQDRTASAARSFERRLQQMESGSARLSNALSIVGRFGGFGVLAAGAAQATSSITAEVIEVERLNKALEVATGGGRNFLVAQSDIERQLNTTLSTQAELTESYRKLANLGITPTIARMRAFENIAVGSAKSLDQFIEAVADASTNEFERLKEFGVRASQQGDQVAFTFRGVTTTVEKNSQEIVNFLQRIGEEQFGDAVSSQLETISGQSSDATKEISRLRNELVRLSGAPGAIAAGMGATADAAQRLRFELEGTPETIAQLEERISALQSETSTTTGVVSRFLSTFLGKGLPVGALLDKITRDDLPELQEQLNQLNQIDAYQTFGASRLEGIQAFIDREQELVADRDANTAKIDQQVSKRAQSLTREIALYGQTSAAQKALFETTQGQFAGASDERKQELIDLAAKLDSLKAQTQATENQAKAAERARNIQQSFLSLVSQSNPLDRINTDLIAANDLIEDYNETRAANERATLEQRAAVFESFGQRVATVLSQNIPLGSIEGLDRLDATFQQQLTRIAEIGREQISNQEVINAARLELDRRYELQKANIEEGIAQETLERQQAVLQQIQQLAASGSLFNGITSTTDVQDNTLATEQEKADAIVAITQQRVDRVNQILGLGASQSNTIAQQAAAFEKANAAQKTDFLIGQTQSLLSTLSSQSRTAFEITKAASIAEAIINAHRGASAALKFGPPFGIGLAGLYYAQGIAQVNAIRNTSFRSSSAGAAPSGTDTTTSDSTDTSTPATGLPDGAANAGAQVNVTINAIDTQSGAQAFARYMNEAQEQNLFDNNGAVIQYNYGVAA